MIKRIGNFATLNYAVPEPLPGPETALSRAAEQNPSTPNAVWVTPSTGGRGTKFTFHFHALLNEATYTTRISGPAACRGHYLYGASPAEGPPADNLRGHIYNAPLGSSHTKWCPGTYHLSVTAISGPFDHALNAPAKPFGTTTFAVP